MLGFPEIRQAISVGVEFMLQPEVHIGEGVVHAEGGLITEAAGHFVAGEGAHYGGGGQDLKGVTHAGQEQV